MRKSAIPEKEEAKEEKLNKHTEEIKVPSMDISQSERLEILFSGFLTAGIISAIYLIIYFLIVSIIRMPTTSNFILNIKTWMYQSNNYNMTMDFITFLYVFALFSILFIQTRRRLERARLNHILDYVEYMGLGNYDQRIPVEKTGRYHTVAENINELMDNIKLSISKQQESEKSKDELITNVGHDIRTPLTSVIGYIDILRKKENLSEEQKIQYLEVAYSKAKSMEILVNDLFDYVKSIDSQMQLDLIENISMEGFLSQVVMEFQIQAEKKSIELMVDVEPENLLATFDPDKMARVFGNLVNNALKYGIGASHIILKAKTVDNQTYREETNFSFNENTDKRFKDIHHWVICEVRNNGELIPEEYLENIYARSYRGDKSRNYNEPGSGLGLSIARNIVNMHGGNTFAQIEEDELIFRIDIPQGAMRKYSQTQ